MGQNFHKIEAVRLEGGDPSQAVSLTAFYEFFFITSLNIVSNLKKYYPKFEEIPS